MGINVISLNASRNLSSYKIPIRQAIVATVKKARRRIAVGDVDILVKESEHPEYLKEIGGVGGYCPSGHLIEISVDPKNLGFRKDLKVPLERSLSHELHHAVRWQKSISLSEETFLECMMSEGLADYFSFEMTGIIPVWADALSGKDKRRMKKRIRARLNDKLTDGNYLKWFTGGDGKAKIPRWTGYTLGFDMIKNYLENHPEQSAASLAGVRTERIKSALDV